MADGLTFKIEGLGTLENRLKELDNRLAKKAMRKALTKGAKPITEEARRRAPVLTGKLRKNVKASISASTKKAEARIGFKKTAFYGRFIETGVPARGIAARPFLRPALDLKGQEGVNAFADELRTQIDKVTGMF